MNVAPPWLANGSSASDVDLAPVALRKMGVGNCHVFHGSVDDFAETGQERMRASDWPQKLSKDIKRDQKRVFKGLENTFKTL